MALESLKVPTSSGVITETLVENKVKEPFYNETTKKYEEKEVLSTTAKYRGGSIYGFSIKSKGAAEFLLYDNSEKAEGTCISGPIYFKEKESRIFFFPVPVRFKEGLYFKIVSGELEEHSIIWADVE